MDFVRFDLPNSSYGVSWAGWERGREFAEKRKPREATDTQLCVSHRWEEGAHLKGWRKDRMSTCWGAAQPQKAPYPLSTSGPSWTVLHASPRWTATPLCKLRAITLFTPQLPCLECKKHILYDFQLKYEPILNKREWVCVCEQKFRMNVYGGFWE